MLSFYDKINTVINAADGQFTPAIIGCLKSMSSLRDFDSVLSILTKHAPFCLLVICQFAAKYLVIDRALADICNTKLFICIISVHKVDFQVIQLNEFSIDQLNFV